MSLTNEAVVDDSTELESDLEQTLEEVTSEQTESEDSQGVATESKEAEQSGETDDDIDLSDVLSGKSEPEQNESKVPRSTRRLLRKNNRLEKELAEAQRQVEQLTNSQPPAVKPQIPERDWDNNETDEQFNFRSMQAVLGHQQQVQQSSQQHERIKEQANQDLKLQREAVEKYNDEAESLNLNGYSEAESRVLDAMPEGSLSYMSKINPSMTAKIIYHLDHNPEKLEKFANLARTNAHGFNYEFGRLEAAIAGLEDSARRNKNSVSKATGDRALEGSGSAANSIQSKMDKAAESGDITTYRKLKAQLK